jgi:hypothetical protein
MLTRTRHVAWLAAFTAWGIAPLRAARADEAPQICSEAFSSSAALGKAGKLTRARDALVKCASDACPAAMRPLCVADLRAIEGRIPTIVLGATGSAGDLTDVQVTMDGQPLSATIDGRAVEMDPGSHTIRFEHAGVVVERLVVVREGEKDRRVIAAFTATPALAPSGAPAVVADASVAPRRPVPLGAWISGGATVVAAGFWAGFGATAFSQKSSLDACRGTCTASAVSSARAAFLGADIAGGSTLALATLTTLLYVTRASVVPGARTSVAVVPTWRGASAMLNREF